ncbi:hypothetical protein [Streptomyces sp. NPDC001404]|uniref:hypothetical protein n=1 Tax=Streptomyces sp. NPDC001404 TaxID=3364571 RepID=UPI0036CF46E6
MRITKKKTAIAATALSVALLGLGGLGAQSAAAASAAPAPAVAPATSPVTAGIYIASDHDLWDDVAPGEEFLVHGTVTNNTDHDLNDLHIDMALSKAEIVGPVAPASGIVTNTAGHGKAVWKVPTLRAGATYHLDVLFKLSELAQPGTKAPLNLTVLSQAGDKVWDSKTAYANVVAPQK